jgi:putative transposase
MARKGTRYSEEQIIRILKEVETGTTAAEVSRKHGEAEQTVYRWRNKYGGLDNSELQRLRELESSTRQFPAQSLVQKYIPRIPLMVCIRSDESVPVSLWLGFDGPIVIEHFDQDDG